MICKICNISINGRIGNHIRTHKIKFEDYLIQYEHNGIIPKCKCGCNKQMKFDRGQGQFNNYLYGHNFQDKEANNIKYKKIRENYKKGIFKSWNKGLTKDTDIRVLKCAKLKKLYKFTEQHKKNLANSQFIRRMTNPYYRNKNFMHGIYKNEFYDSSFELARFLFFEESNIKFTKKHHLRIYYNFEGKKHYYVPDILINNKILEEIKPSFKLKDPQTKAKIKAGKRFCKKNNLKFRIITEKEIGKKFLKQAKILHKGKNL